MKRAAIKAGLSLEELNAKLDALAALVNDGNLRLVSQMIAGSKDAWLFEALLAGSTINDGKWVLGVGLERFDGDAEMVGLLAWAYAPEGAEMDDSFEDKTQRIELEIEFTEENLEPIAACLKEYITPRFPSLNITSKEWLHLSGLTTLSDAAAESLSKNKGSLHLHSLTTLSDAAAESLSKHEGYLVLDCLTTLTDAAAESLSKNEGDLNLDGLTTLSDAAAESLSKHEGDLNLGGLTTLSDAAAESLSKYKGSIYLSYELADQVARFKK